MRNKSFQAFKDSPGPCVIFFILKIRHGISFCRLSTFAERGEGASGIQIITWFVQGVEGEKENWRDRTDLIIMLMFSKQFMAIGKIGRGQLKFGMEKSPVRITAAAPGLKET